MKNTVHAFMLAVLGWLCLSPAAAKPPVTPDLSGYVTASGRGIGVQQIALPAAYTARWTPPFGIFRDALGRYSTDFAGWPTVPAVPDQVYCLNNSPGGGGSNSNTGSCGTPDAAHPHGGPGTSGYSPWNSLLRAVQAATAGKTTVVYIDGSSDMFFRGNNGTNPTASLSWASGVPAGPLYVVNTSGFRAVSLSTPSAGPQTWTQNGTYPQVYQTSFSLTTFGGIVDVGATVRAVNPSGGAVPVTRDPFYVYKGVKDLATVAATPGTWWADATNNVAYVNPAVSGPNPTGDGSIITVARPARTGVGTGGNANTGSDVLWFNNTNNGRHCNATAGCVTYVDGIDFVGGQTAFKAQSVDANTPTTLVLRNVTMSGSGQNGSTVSNVGFNAFPMLGPVTAYNWRVAIYGGWADNFNAHSISANGNNEPSPNLITVECTSWGAGLTGDFVLFPNTSGQQDDAWTNHDGSMGFDLNSLYFGTHGITMAGGTNYAMKIVFGSTIAGSIAPNLDGTNAGTGFGWAISSGATNSTWLDGVTLVPTQGNGVATVNNGNVAGYTPFLGWRNMPAVPLDRSSAPGQPGASPTFFGSY